MMWYLYFTTLCCAPLHLMNSLQMGLGKTLQAITFLSYLKCCKESIGPFCKWNSFNLILFA